MENQIIKRSVIDEIVKFLDTNNTIVLHGARQVGKTYIMYYLENLLQSQNKPSFFIDLEDFRMVEILDKGVESFLAYLKEAGADLTKKLYVFIDEIQYLDRPSSFLKLMTDHHKEIQLIVSGSSSFNIKKKFTDSLVGRTINFEIFNLTFAEFLTFKGIKYQLEEVKSEFHLEKIRNFYLEYILYGGYPKIVLTPSLDLKERLLQEIVNTYVKKDIRDLAEIKEIKKFNNLLKIMAGQSGQLLNIAKLADLCRLSKQTVENYLYILEETYMIKLIPPYSSSVKVEVVKAPKIFFFDTGLLHILWLNHLPKTILGNIFETSVFAELVKKYGRENIRFWRTRNQTEIDFILDYKGKLIPIEVKLQFRNLRKRGIRSFCKKYQVVEYKIVGLDGERKEKEEIYPWQI